MDFTETFDVAENTDVVKKEKPKSKPRQTFKMKECAVKRYDKTDKSVVIDFDGYGLMFSGVKKDYTNVEFVKVKYKGTIGKPKFVCQIEE